MPAPAGLRSQSFASILKLSCVIAAAVWLGLPTLSAWAADPADEYHVFFGTYTGGSSKGIYRSRFNAKTGELGEPSLVAPIINPSFIALHPTKPLLYSVSEVDRRGDETGGSVSAFRLDRTTGELKALNTQPSGGSGPCYVTVDRTGGCVLVANYNNGTVSTLPIAEDGALKEIVTTLQHEGSSINKSRQEGPHAHSIVLDPSNHFTYSPDLGCDQIFISRFEAATCKLLPNTPPSASVAAGSGPRHLAFHPNGRFAYVINELTSTITAFRYKSENGELTPLETVSTLPKDYRASTNSTAEIVVHPEGKWLVGSNRGHDSVAVFGIDPEAGTLKLGQITQTGGKTPRNIAFDPTGRWLLVAHQDSDTVAVFGFDATTGELTLKGTPRKVFAPVCIRFSPVVPKE